MISIEEFKELKKWHSIEVTSTDGKRYLMVFPKLIAKEWKHTADKVEFVTLDEPLLGSASTNEIGANGKVIKNGVYVSLNRSEIAEIKYYKSNEDEENWNNGFQFIVGAIIVIIAFFYFFT